MHILILYSASAGRQRQTDKDYLYSFRRYGKGHHFYYLNVRCPKNLFAFLVQIPFDAVIIEHSLLSIRYAHERWELLYEALGPWLKAMPGCKVMAPNDDYHYTGELRRLVEEAGITLILTPVATEEYEIYYPGQMDRGVKIYTAHTGYIDNRSVPRIKKRMEAVQTRDIDIGYRARKLFSGGEHGWLKVLLAQRVGDAARRRQGLRTDIGTTGNTENVKLGQDWLDFLLRCRTMLGCLGGSSLLDVDGEVLPAIDAYVATHPEADFAEVAAACFAGCDGLVQTFAIGPRHYECAMTKTCQILVEGDYDGVFLPGVHYIELKKDFSNLEDVLDKVADEAYCAEIARRCHEDIVGDGSPDNPNTYAWFVNDVLAKIQAERAREETEAPSYNWAIFGLYFAWRTRMASLAWRCGAGAKKAGQAVKTVYYRLCEFSARHPGLQKAVGWLKGRNRPKQD